MKGVILRIFAVVFFLAGCWYTFSSGLVLLSGQTERTEMRFVGGVPEPVSHPISRTGLVAGMAAGLWAIAGSVGLLKRERWGWRTLLAFFSLAVVWSILQQFVLPVSAGGVPAYSPFTGRVGRIALPLIPLALLFWLRSEIEREPQETAKSVGLGI